MPQTVDLRPGRLIMGAFAGNQDTIACTFEAPFDVGSESDWTAWIAPSPTDTHLFDLVVSLSGQTLTVTIPVLATSTLRNTQSFVYIALSGQVMLAPDIFFAEDGGAPSTDEVTVFASGDVSVIVTSTAGAGSGGDPNAVRHIAVPIAFDTPGLSVPVDGVIPGVELFTPAVDDILVDAWVQTTIHWDGSSFLDIGPFDLTNVGLFANSSGAGPVDVTDHADRALSPGTLQGSSSSRSLVLDMSAAVYRLVPILFTAASPLLVIVSDNGQSDGNDPTASQGSAVVHLLVA